MTDPSLHYNLMLIKLAFETNGKSELPRNNLQDVSRQWSASSLSMSMGVDILRG